MGLNMIPLKRKSSESNDEDGPDDFKRTKHTDIWDDKHFSTVDDALAEIELLKSHLDIAIRFINKKNLTSSVPDPLKPVCLSRLGSKTLYRSLRDNIDDVAERLTDKTTYLDCKLTGDDLSVAMAEFLPAIRDIAECPDSEALETAYRVLWYAKEQSYDEDGTGNGERPSDELFDEFLKELIERRREKGEVWDWERDLKELEEEREGRRGVGIERWFERSLEALRGLVEGN
ncbi:hypothetical protein QBC38DRAFT_549660 [Podospora fimiseda]|uniref:Uncharacterized protein n=1 Tax=Podospora fimiseda TaxID=252190 RepID=A0AAN6YMC4_9PEZI|nr:hypothetical protein QBC38DRAFT_549660 [Podospora fimiseda]